MTAILLLYGWGIQVLDYMDFFMELIYILYSFD